MPSGGSRKNAGRPTKDTERFGISLSTKIIEKYGVKKLREIIHEFINTL